MDWYDDLELVQRFRFSRLAILKITELLQDHLNSTDRSHVTLPHLQFFASGTFQLICGDGVHVSQPSTCRYIRAVALGLQSICSRYISLPSSAEKATIKSQFYELTHFPGHGSLRKSYWSKKRGPWDLLWFLCKILRRIRFCCQKIFLTQIFELFLFFNFPFVYVVGLLIYHIRIIVITHTLNIIHPSVTFGTYDRIKHHHWQSDIIMIYLDIIVYICSWNFQ